MTEKVGVDDFLAAGHTLDELRALAVDDIDEPEAESLALRSPVYCIHDDQFCLVKNMDGIKVKTPLCNFTAQIVDEIILDDGIQEMRTFVLEGLQKGHPLPPVQVPASQFHNLIWITERWGSKAICYAGSATKDHLRTIIQISSNGLNPRRVFTHTGWREVDGKRVFLTASGALAHEGVEVLLNDPLSRYKLPVNVAEVDPVTAMQASLRFLGLGKPEVMCPLWSVMYLAPLCEVLDPAFTLWLIGPTGSFKSVASALATSHFGHFTYLSLPASWRDTANRLEWAMSMLKDLPLVIDDFRPAYTTAAQRELELKAEIVVRAQANKAGRGRLRADASPRNTYTPRGMVVSTGEQLPSGESEAARLFVVELERQDINTDELTAAQNEQGLYPYAMANYILWLKENWTEITPVIRKKWEEYRQKATAKDIHLRLPAAVASLYCAFDLAMAHALEIGAIDGSESRDRLEGAWDVFTQLAVRQGWRVDEERPATRFLDTFRTLLLQQRLLLISKECIEPMPTDLKPGQTFVGWADGDYFYLIPQAVYATVHDFSQRSGEPFTFKRAAVWADLTRLGLAVRSKDERNQTPIWVGGTDGCTRRVIQLRRSVIEEKSEAPI